MGQDAGEVLARGDVNRKMIRHIVKAVIPAGGSWPESAGGPTDVPPAFFFIRVDNRSAVGADVLISLDGPVKQAADQFGYWDRFNAGERRVRNTGAPGIDAPAKELHILNLSQTLQAIVWVELSMTPIIDIAPGGGTSRQSVSLVDSSGAALQTTLGDGVNPANGVTTAADMAVYNGSAWDRLRSAGPAGTGAAAVGDISVFAVESTVLLGASATFTGPLRDGLNYNWFGAKANVSGGQAGTLFADESSAASGANIYQAASQAAAAEPATHGTPATVGAASFGARIAPQKTVLRFLRAVYVNGAVAQTGTFELQSALSPLN